MKPTSLFTASDLCVMHDEPVMVNPPRTSANPPVGMRGTIRVTRDCDVEIVLQFAVMFDRPAEVQTIRLSPAQVATLRAAKARNGEYAITLNHTIDAPEGRGYVVASPRL